MEKVIRIEKMDDVDARKVKPSNGSKAVADHTRAAATRVDEAKDAATAAGGAILQSGSSVREAVSAAAAAAREVVAGGAEMVGETVVAAEQAVVAEAKDAGARVEDVLAVGHGGAGAHPQVGGDAKTTGAKKSKAKKAKDRDASSVSTDASTPVALEAEAARLVAAARLDAEAARRELAEARAEAEMLRASAAALHHPEAAPDGNAAPTMPDLATNMASKTSLGASALGGIDPFVGFDRRQILSSTLRVVTRLTRRPLTAASTAAKAGSELAKVVVGRSDVAPERGDRRWADQTWTENGGYKRLMQAYLVWRKAVFDLVDASDLDKENHDRAGFAATLLVDAVAPTNTLIGNPMALKRAYETGGTSLLKGLRHLIDDLLHNGGLPSQVDGRPFSVGGNLANSPGAVVYRDEVCEIIQYKITAETMLDTPVLVIPPQINKFYMLDLAPGRSCAEHMVAKGVPFFVISWRNPTKEQRDWDLDTYVATIKSALTAVLEITGAPKAHIMGACAGGMTMAAFAGHMRAMGDDRIATMTFLVTVLDTEAPTTLTLFASDRTVAAAVRSTQSKGVMDGRDMARVFAWLRPNDLVWTFWINNYLLGNDPPAFDILYWNNDTTRLPAGLHVDLLRMSRTNPLLKDGALTVLGTPINLKNIAYDTFVVAGATDHITPWQACYHTTRIIGGKTTFLLTGTGHVQSVISPPGNPKAKYYVAADSPPTADEWMLGATEFRGSWWDRWITFVEEHSGGRKPLPQELGSARYPAGDPAPGRYVKQK